MPYIAMNRTSIDTALLHVQPMINSEGTLNYAITRLITNYIRQNGGLSYQRINEVMGVLDCAGKEFYRRVAAPYEDEKCLSNGEVYDDLAIQGKAENTA